MSIDVSDGADVPAPEELADDALRAAMEILEEIGGDVDMVERAMAEREAISAFADGMAEATLRGASRSVLSLYAGMLSDETEHANKTDIKDDVDRAIEQASKGTGTGGESQPVNAFLEDHLEEITAVRSTDAKQSTLYRWTFDHPEAGTFEIESGTMTDASHFAWQSLRNSIFDVSGVWSTRPPEALRGSGDWAEFIGPLIEERAESVTTKGPRSTAVDSLANYVHRTKAYASIEDMVDHNGLRLDDAPEDDGGDPSELWIPSTEISKICDDFAITERALQVELDARGHTVERIGGVSETTFVHGDKYTYWVLSADFADPLGYDPDPETSVERIERLFEGDGEEEEGEEEEPGLIGSTETEIDVESETETGGETDASDDRRSTTSDGDRDDDDGDGDGDDFQRSAGE